jgi:hypothetical protein
VPIVVKSEIETSMSELGSKGSASKWREYGSGNACVRRVGGELPGWSGPGMGAVDRADRGAMHNKVRKGELRW